MNLILNNWQSNYRPKVTERDNSGRVKKVKFKVLIDNPDIEFF